MPWSFKRLPKKAPTLTPICLSGRLADLAIRRADPSVDAGTADALAQLVPPIAIRLRRDFKTVLLIRAHALLHQASRLKDEQGRVVATLEDYAAVRELVADLVAEGGRSNPGPEIREVVEAAALSYRQRVARRSAR